MKKPKPPPASHDDIPKGALTDFERQTRDSLAEHVMAVCVGDLSRHLADGRMPKQDVPAAVDFIASLAYQMADAMLRMRTAK